MAQPAATAESADTRTRILEAALSAFAEDGYEGATTREIVARAGVNHGLIAYYFGSKTTLWREAVDLAFAELRADFEGTLEATSELADRERLARLIRDFVRFSARRPEFARLMQEEGKRESERMEWLVDRHVRPIWSAVRELVERARAGGIRGLATSLPPVHFHYVLVGAATALFHQAPECRRLTGIDPEDPTVIEAHADAVVALLLGATPNE